MNYLLDTNACIAIVNGRPAAVRERLERALSEGHEVTTSSVVLFELWYGVAKSAYPERNSGRLAAFLAGPLGRLDFDQDDAREAGAIRAQLEAAGRPIGAYDLLIAAQARRRGATLVTADAREFDRVAELRWADWSTDGHAASA